MWISVCNWRKFQHYDPAKRRPIWIKNNLDLMSRDEYRELTAHQRAILHGLWLEYASSGCQLRANTASLSSRLALRVTKRQLESLSDAGFIALVASRSLADGYQPASTEVEVEEEKEVLRALRLLEAPPPSNGKALTEEIGRTIEASLAEAKRRGA